MSKPIAWHFSGPKLRDGKPIPPIGYKLVFPHKPILCEQGLHFSLHPFDALRYAPGPLLHRVQYGGIVEMGGDKGVCTERTILASIDATDLLRKFACDEALSVLPANAPDIVRRYLTMRDESLRKAALYATRNTEWDAVRDAVRGAAGEAAWSAAWYAARNAAWGAAWDAAGDVARSAAWSAEGNAAWSAARDKKQTEQRATFLAMVEEAFA